MNKIKQCIMLIITLLFIAGCDELITGDSVELNQQPKLTASHTQNTGSQGPTITGTRQMTIAVGEQLDLLTGVQAIDPEDGDITDRISVDNSNVNLTIPGHYLVTYMVSDSDGNLTTAYTLVEVEEHENTKPIIVGVSKIQVGLGETPDLLDGIRASDLEDGDLTDQITINDQNVDINQKGSYLISYTVTDTAGDSRTEYTIVEVVSDVSDHAPTITGINAITLTVTDTPRDPSVLETDLLYNISATDPEDGDLTKEIVVNYSMLDQTTPGTYLIHYQVEDGDGHKTTVPTLVTVVNSKETNLDSTIPPVITGVQDFMVTVGSDLPNLLEGVTAIDNSDGDLTSDIIINKNNLDLNTVGVYMITYEVTDSDGNLGKAVALVRVYDELTTTNQTSIVQTVETVYDGIVGVTNTQSGQIASTGSGVVYKQDGNDYYIVTNHHVVDGAESVEIVYKDLRYQVGELLGSDAKTDLAVIRITTTKDLPVLNMRDTSTLKLGETAIAIGSPLGFEYYGSVTTGVISGLDRYVAVDTDNDGQVDTESVLIQHDVAISPGNSGGALIDQNGNLIGINVLKIVEEKVSNMGFAIPIRTVKRVVSDIEMYGSVQRAYLGIMATDVSALIDDPNYSIPSDITSGVYIETVQTDTAAAKAQLQVGDIIVGLDQYEIDSMRKLKSVLEYYRPGDQALITYNRNGVEDSVYVLFK
ncbi:immunoglobulin-like domain-containing protein [Haloplasma contractile]|uniref:Serine protease Do protein n=1 Tax=Haloplasma contractile SSD-17B TaxID=1033810 RepID=F7PU56_9MOLU|nr:immunoglobulin-like domain-containing protein [Haloplasma contractile]ERJ11766.1 serine protease Do protein [Haloplasma contractile SSD-17B]